MGKIINVLVADNSEAKIIPLTKMLSKINRVKRMYTAKTLKKAQLIMRRQCFDFVILDLQLADAHGWDLVRFIKKNFPKTKVIILTCYSAIFFRTFSKKIGADYFLDDNTEILRLPEILAAS